MKAIGTPQLRETVRQWLVARNDLAARKAIRKHVEEGQGVHETIIKVLGVRDWKAAMKARVEARKEARATAKQSKVQVKTVKVKKPANREGRIAKAA